MPPGYHKPGPAAVLADLGHQLRTDASKLHSAGYLRRSEAGEPVLGIDRHPELAALAERCERWGWARRVREDPVALEAEARAVSAGGG